MPKFDDQPCGVDSPTTFRERVAFALASHDIRGGEGRMEDDEFAALETVMRLMPWQAVPNGVAHRQALTRFMRLERGFRNERMPIAEAHLINAFWRDYLPAADAVLSVLMEKPEVVAAIVTGGEP